MDEGSSSRMPTPSRFPLAPMLLLGVALPDWSSWGAAAEACMKNCRFREDLMEMQSGYDEVASRSALLRAGERPAADWPPVRTLLWKLLSNLPSSI